MRREPLHLLNFMLLSLLVPGLFASGTQAAGLSCETGETLFWQCEQNASTDFLLCGGRLGSQFSAPYLELREFHDGELVTTFPANRDTRLTVESNLYAANYDLVMKSGSQHLRMFESIRSDDDEVSFEDSEQPDAGWGHYCRSVHDELLKASSFGIDENAVALNAENLAKASRAIGSLRAKGRARPLSNEIHLDEHKRIVVERTYMTAVPMGDGRTRNVYDTLPTVVDPYDVVSFAVNHGSSAHLVEGEDTGYCSLVGLQMDVRLAPDSSDTKPVSFYACADKTAQMRRVFKNLSALMSSLAARPVRPQVLREEATWNPPSTSQAPYLAVIESHCEVQFEPFDQVCAEHVRPITDLSTGKDHAFRRVLLVDPNGMLDGKPWRVRVGMNDVEQADATGSPMSVNISGAAEPFEVAKQLLSVNQEDRLWVYMPSDDPDAVRNQIYQDRERLAYLIGYFPWVGIHARYELIVDGMAQPLGTITVNYPGS